MGSLFSHWDDDPFFVDSYNSPFIYYFDLILLPIACMVVTIIFIQWVYELHCSKIRKTINKATKKDTSIGSKSKSGSSQTKNKSKSKPKVDLSLPTVSKTQLSGAGSFSASDTKKQSTSPKSKPKPKTKPKSKSKSKRHQEIHPISKILTTTSIFCAMCYLYCTLCIVILSTHRQHPDCIWISLNFEIVYTQRYCLYIYYLFRAYLTFQKSSHKISKKKMIILVSVITFVWIFGEIFYIIWNSVINNCTEGSNIISIIPLGVTETVTSSFCVALFYSKLRKVYKPKKHGRNNSATEKPVPMNYKLQYLFAKLMILAGTAIGTTFCVLSFWPFTFAFGLMAIDTPINVSCMVLSFAFYDKYYKIFCAPCRRCFEPPKPPPIVLEV